jgi:hypothetical protein
MRSLLAVALVAAAASTASAEGYLGLGIGTAARPSGDLPMTTGDGNRSYRALGGYSFGRFSIEATVSRFGELRRNSYQYDGTMLSAAGKYSYPLGDNFEAFGRLGLERTWLSTDPSNLPDYVGNGWLIGAGFEYRFTVAATGASALVGYEHSSSSLANQNAMSSTVGESVGIWMLAVTVSL